MQKGISFVGLMDLGTLDAVKKSSPVKIVRIPSELTERKINLSSPVARVSETPGSKSAISSPLDMRPC